MLAIDMAEEVFCTETRYGKIESGMRGHDAKELGLEVFRIEEVI